MIEWLSMPGREPFSVKRFILWDYPRAGWQYDVLVAIILAFIFLTPREWFRDQPRASSIVTLSLDQYWIEPKLLENVPEAQRPARAAELVRVRAGGRHSLVRLETIFNAEHEIQGYMAYTKR